MTHPIGSLTIFSPNTDVLSSSHTHTHTTDDHQYTESTTKRGIVDYLVVPQDDPSRPAVYTSGDLYTFLATTKETNFGFNAFDFFVPLGGGPPPHIHNYEQEAFFVKQGNVHFFLGNEAGVPNSNKEFVLNALPPGTFIFGPRLRPHGFANPDSTTAISGTNEGARILSLTTPGGLDLLFEFAGIPVASRNDPIPPPPVGFDPKQLEFGQRTGGGIAFPGYEPPEGTPQYILVLPDDAPQGIRANIESQVAGVDDFSISTYSERPRFTGLFGIEYTSLASFQETNNELSYSQFFLTPQVPDPLNDFPNLVESNNHEVFYVREGQLSIQIGGDVKVAGPDTLVYIPPDTEYSIANFGATEVDALAVSIAPQADYNTVVPSFLNPQDSISPEKVVFLSNEADIFHNLNDCHRRIYGGGGNDELFANQDDRLFGEEGNDLLDASGSKGNNRLDGGKGNDLLLAGTKDQLFGSEGDDILIITGGGDNLLYGGSGADQFWIVNSRLPNTVPETRQLTDLGLPPLQDTRNTIVDFEKGVDKIYIRGISSISSFNDLKLLPVFGDIRSTSILARVDGTEGEVSLANVSGIIFNELTAEDFVFV